MQPDQKIKWHYCRKIMWRAIIAQHTLTYGERRSPILLSFQSIPRKPECFTMFPGSTMGSKIVGLISLMYAQLHISSRRTVRRLERSNKKTIFSKKFGAENERKRRSEKVWLIGDTRCG